MTQAKQSEALRLAAFCEENDLFVVAYTLRTQNDRILELDAKMMKEAARTAQEKLRADKMSQQHDTQAALNSEARNELAQARSRILELEACHTEELRAYELTVSNLRAKVEELEQRKCLHQIAEPWKDHRTAALVNDLRDCAKTYAGTEQLRERIATIVAPLCDQLKAAERAQHAAAPQAVQPAVPDGWKLVPMEPQDMQQVAGAQAIRFDTTVINKMWTANKVYREMVAAAPAHPAEGVPAQTVPEIDERAAFDDFFRKRNRLHPDTDTTFRSDAAEPWKYWKARAAIAATQPAAQGLDADSAIRHLAIGRAIERVSVELPDGAEISISLEKGAGTVTLIDGNGDEQENFPTDDGFAGTLNAALDTAIADEAAQQPQEPACEKQ